AQDGRRFLVANDVYFHYRNRPRSMSKAVSDRDTKTLFIHDALRTAVNLERVTPLAYLAFCASVHAPEPSPPPQPAPPQPAPQQLEPQQPAPPEPELPEPEPPESQPREWQPLPSPQVGPLNVAAPPLAKRIEDKVKEFAFRRLEAFPRTRSVVRKVYRLLR